MVRSRASIIVALVALTVVSCTGGSDDNAPVGTTHRPASTSSATPVVEAAPSRCLRSLAWYDERVGGNRMLPSGPSVAVLCGPDDTPDRVLPGGERTIVTGERLTRLVDLMNGLRLLNGVRLREVACPAWLERHSVRFAIYFNYPDPDAAIPRIGLITVSLSECREVSDGILSARVSPRLDGFLRRLTA